MADVFEPKFYREWASGSRLESFAVHVEETDLAVKASASVRAETKELVLKYRRQLTDYACSHPRFLTSFEPVETESDAPSIARLMAEAGSEYSVGPMAAVAGAMAELVGEDLLRLLSDRGIQPPEVIVENGGDCFIKTAQPAIVSLYAGPQSPFSGKLKLSIDTAGGPRGLCTSSGTVGHSVSFGKADAVVVLAASAALADAAATAIGNLIREPDVIREVIEREKKRQKLLGLMIAMGRHLGAWGELEIVR